MNFASSFFLTTIRHSVAGRRLSNRLCLLTAVILAGILSATTAGAQTSVRPPVVILDSYTAFIQPAGKRAVVYTRLNSSAKWAFATEFPTNVIPHDQFVVYKLSGVTNTTQVKVDFK